MRRERTRNKVLASDMGHVHAERALLPELRHADPLAFLS